MAPKPSTLSHSDILALWPMRVDIARALRVKYPAVVAWETFGHIPEKYWPALIADAAARGIAGVTADALQAGRDAWIATRRRRNAAAKPRTVKPRAAQPTA